MSNNSLYAQLTPQEQILAETILFTKEFLTVVPVLVELLLTYDSLITKHKKKLSEVSRKDWTVSLKNFLKLIELGKVCGYTPQIKEDLLEASTELDKMYFFLKEITSVELIPISSVLTTLYKEKIIFA